MESSRRIGYDLDFEVSNCPKKEVTPKGDSSKTMSLVYHPGLGFLIFATEGKQHMYGQIPGASVFEGTFSCGVAKGNKRVLKGTRKLLSEWSRPTWALTCPLASIRGSLLICWTAIKLGGLSR